MEEGLVDDGIIAQDEAQIQSLWSWRESIPEATTIEAVFTSMTFLFHWQIFTG